MSREGQKYYTNDRNFNPKSNNVNIQYSNDIKIDPSSLVGQDSDENPNDLPEDVIAGMTAEQYNNYLEEKNDKSLRKTLVGVLSKIGGGIVNTFKDNGSDGRNSSTKNLTSQVILDQKQELTLQDLSCVNIREAFETYKQDKKYLFKCVDINAQNMQKENITVVDLKHYKISLQEIKHKFNINWYDLVNLLNLKPSDFTRENDWFDTTTLSEYVLERTNITDDIGFNIDDIRRLKCADLEISKLGIGFDDLCKIGFTKKDLLAFPWFPDSMCSMLGLRAKHLSASHLDMRKDDFDYLIRNRKGWTREFFVRDLCMKKEFVETIFSYVDEKIIKEQLMYSKKNHLEQMSDSSTQQMQNGTKKKITLKDLYKQSESTIVSEEDSENSTESDELDFNSNSSQIDIRDNNKPISIALLMQKQTLARQFGQNSQQNVEEFQKSSSTSSSSTSRKTNSLKKKEPNHKKDSIPAKELRNTNDQLITKNVKNDTKTSTKVSGLNSERSHVFIDGKRYVEQNDDNYSVEFINSHDQYEDKPSDKKIASASFDVL